MHIAQHINALGSTQLRELDISHMQHTRSVHVRTHVHKSVLACVCVYICMYISTLMQAHTHIHMHMHTHTHTHTHVHIHSYIHTYTRTYISQGTLLFLPYYFPSFPSSLLLPSIKKASLLFPEYFHNSLSFYFLNL